MKVNDRVTYDGVNRPYLKGLVGRVAAVDGNAALAIFTGEGGREFREWVGNSYLNPAPNESHVSLARADVQAKIRDLEKQISALRSQISKLNAANKALKDME